MAGSKLLHVTIARVNEPLFAGSARSVSVPGVDGVMEVMADHTPLITNLTVGKVVVHDEGGERYEYEIAGGTLEVAHNQATILI